MMGLVWFLLIFRLWFIDGLSIDEDIKYVDYYGNNPMSDGIWEVAREMRDDVVRMKNISGQVHYRIFSRTPLITNASLAEKLLVFDESLNYRPMKIDVIAYTTDESVEDGATRPHHFTKALWPDCVYYLEPRDAEARNVSLVQQVCRLEFDLSYTF